MKLTDEQLMLLYARGRTDAFDELFGRHHGRLYGYLARMLGREGAEAQDVLQETFLRVARAAPSYQPTARFTTWLFRVATNCCLNHLEARKRRPHLRLLRTGKVSLQPASAAADPAKTCQAREGARALEAAVAELPETMRSVFLLRQDSGLAYEEIAQVLDMPVGSVKTNLHRARSRLAETLAPYLTEGGAPARARKDGP